MVRRRLFAFFQQEQQGYVSHAYLVGVSEGLLLDGNSIYKGPVVTIEIRNFEIGTDFPNHTVTAGNGRVPQRDIADRLSSNRCLNVGQREGRAFFRAVYRNKTWVHRRPDIYLLQLLHLPTLAPKLPEIYRK